jgi:hypothetical protein
LQEEYGELLFVPTIMLATIDGQLRSAVVWGDGIPTLMPQADAVIVVRDEFAPKPLFRSRTKDTCVAAPDKLAYLFAPFFEKVYAIPVRVPAYERPTRDIGKFFRGLHAFTGQLKVVSVGDVLSEELLGKCG